MPAMCAMKIKIALPLSHHFYEPKTWQHEIWSQLETFEIKCLPEPKHLSKSKEKIFHWGLGPVLSDFQKTFWAEGLGPYLAENNIKLFSFDLGPAANKHLSILPLGPTLSPGEILRRSEKNIKFVRKFYQGTLAVENYNYYPTGLYEHICEPEFISRYLDEFGLGMVLDLAHAAISAFNKQIDIYQYFSSLPLEKVCEIHLSRPYFPQNKKWPAADQHEDPQEEQWAWLNFILQDKRLQKNPIVVIEYYKNFTKIRQSYETLLKKFN